VTQPEALDSAATRCSGSGDGSRTRPLPARAWKLLLHHLATFWERRDAANVMLFHYADLQADLAGEMRGLARRLRIEVDERAWPGLAAEGELRPDARPGRRSRPPRSR